MPVYPGRPTPPMDEQPVPGGLAAIDEVADRLYELNPHLLATDALTVRRLAALTYQADNILLALCTLEVPPLSAGGVSKVSPLLDDYVRLCTLALRYEEVLGITPRNRISASPDSLASLLKD